MDTFILTRIADTLRKLSEIETGMLDTKGPQPCPVLVAAGANPAPPSNEEEKQALWCLALKEYPKILGIIAGGYVSPMEFAHGILGKVVGYLNSSPLKLPGDEETITLGVNALTGRFYNALRQCPNQQAYALKTGNDSSEFVSHDQLPKKRQEEEQNDWLARLQMTAEAKSIADKLDGIALRVGKRTPIFQNVMAFPADNREDLARHQRRRASLTKAAEELSLEKCALLDAVVEYETISVDMVRHWMQTKEAGQCESFPAARYLELLEKAVVKFAGILRQANTPHTVKDDIDWEALPKEHRQAMSEAEARFAFRRAQLVMSLAVEGEPFRTFMNEGWRAAELSQPDCCALREVPAYLRIIMQILAGNMCYPQKKGPPENMPEMVGRLKELIGTLEPWRADTLAEFRFKFEMFAREHQRLHISIPLPRQELDPADLFIKKLDVIFLTMSERCSVEVPNPVKDKPSINPGYEEKERILPSARAASSGDSGTAKPVELSDALSRALRQYQYAVSVLGAPLTDDQAFAWLVSAEELPEDLEMTYTIKERDTWKKALSRARRVTGTNKNSPRRGRTANSVRKRDEI